MGTTGSKTITVGCIDESKQCLQDGAFKVEGNTDTDIFELMYLSRKFAKDLDMPMEPDPNMTEEDSKKMANEKCNAKFPGTKMYNHECCSTSLKGNYKNLQFSLDKDNKIVIDRTGDRAPDPNKKETTTTTTDPDGTIHTTVTLADEGITNFTAINLTNSNNQICPVSRNDDTISKCPDRKQCILDECLKQGYTNVLDAYQYCRHPEYAFGDRANKDANNFVTPPDCDPLPFCNVASFATLPPANTGTSASRAAVAITGNNAAPTGANTTTSNPVSTDTTNPASTNTTNPASTDTTTKAVTTTDVTDDKNKSVFENNKLGIVIGVSVMFFIILMLIIFMFMR